MSVYIKGMGMPMSCRQCSLYLQSMDSERNVYENCAVTAKSYNWGLTTRPSDCPLVPVPEQLLERFEKEEKAADEHGRDFSFSFKSGGENCTEWWPVQVMLMDAPTIIPAEEGET